MKFRSGRVVGACTLAALVAGAAVAVGAIPDNAGTIHACYATGNGLLLGIPYSKGDLRAIDESETCRSYEKPVSWNQQGQSGNPGATGPAGPAGPAGTLPPLDPVTLVGPMPADADCVAHPGTFCMGALAGGPIPAWVNYGNGFADAGFYKDQLGFVHLDGVIRSNAGKARIFYLPPAFRPTVNRRLPVADGNSGAAGGQGGYVEIATDGAVQASNVSAAFLSLDGVVFRQ